MYLEGDNTMNPLDDSGELLRLLREILRDEEARSSTDTMGEESFKEFVKDKKRTFLDIVDTTVQNWQLSAIGSAAKDGHKPKLKNGD